MSRLITDITSHILNAPDRTAATGKGIRILAKMHARKDRQMTTATTPERTPVADLLALPTLECDYRKDGARWEMKINNHETRVWVNIDTNAVDVFAWDGGDLRLVDSY
jgi:hypothetical protein